MSQLGGQIQTIDAYSAPGLTNGSTTYKPTDDSTQNETKQITEYKGPRYETPQEKKQREEEIKRHAHLHPNAGEESAEEKRQAAWYKQMRDVSDEAKRAPGYAAPGSSPIRAPRHERVVYPAQINNPYSANLRDKNPLNTYTYSSWPTHWPDGTPRNEPLPVEWDPSTTTVHNKPLKGPYDPYRRRQKLQAGHDQYHTHWADGSERTNKLDPTYQNPGTHDDSGRRVKPANYNPSTHFSNFKLKPVYDPNRPKKNPSLPEQHTQHENVEIQKLQEQVRQLKISNHQKDNQIRQANEAKADMAAKNSLLRQQQSERAPMSRPSRGNSATPPIRGRSKSATSARGGGAVGLGSGKKKGK